MFDKNLRMHLALAQRWDCIVLLEDAEIYLSERDDNMDRNRIVSSEWPGSVLSPQHFGLSSLGTFNHVVG